MGHSSAGSQASNPFHPAPQARQKANCDSPGLDSLRRRLLGLPVEERVDFERR